MEPPNLGAEIHISVGKWWLHTLGKSALGSSLRGRAAETQTGAPSGMGAGRVLGEQLCVCVVQPRAGHPAPVSIQKYGFNPPAMLSNVQ